MQSTFAPINARKPICYIHLMFYVGTWLINNRINNEVATSNECVAPSSFSSFFLVASFRNQRVVRNRIAIVWPIYGTTGHLGWRRQGRRIAGTIASFHSTGLCSAWSCIKIRNYIHYPHSRNIKHKTYFKISDQSGCSPTRPGRAAWIRHGSSMMQALGPSSARICFSAKEMSTADRDKSKGWEGSDLRLRDL